jgi:glycosyltransferase involved in cell wall biosynthesis
MIAYANYYNDARIKNYVETLIKNGFEVDIFALGTHKLNEQKTVRVFTVMQKYWGDNALFYALSQLWFFCIVTFQLSISIFRRHYRIIHVHNIPDFLVFCAILPKLFGAKVILDIHDTMPEAYATKFDLPLTHPLVTLSKIEEKLSAWFAKQVITTNDLHKEVIASHGVPTSKIDIILNLGNENIFRPVQREKTMSGLTLSYHGTIAERLGIDLIVKAIAKAREFCPDLHLLLIGEGDYLETIKCLVDDLKVSDIIQIIGFVPVEELPRYLCNVDVGIIGNRYYTEIKQNYMLPVKMLEYAAMEIPTIAPRLKSICCYFNEDSAIYYMPDDIEDMAGRIVEVYKERSIIDKKKEGLRNFNQIYNWRTMEERYLGIIHHLVGSNSQESGR